MSGPVDFAAAAFFATGFAVFDFAGAAFDFVAGFLADFAALLLAVVLLAEFAAPVLEAEDFDLADLAAVFGLAVFDIPVLDFAPVDFAFELLDLAAFFAAVAFFAGFDALDLAVDELPLDLAAPEELGLPASLVEEPVAINPDEVGVVLALVDVVDVS